MGDLLGSPRFAPLFLGLAGYHSGFPHVVPMVRPSPSPSAPGDHRSGHPNSRYGPSKSHVWDFSPVFCRMKDPTIRGRSAETAGFLDGRGESYGWKRLVEGMGPVGDR